MALLETHARELDIPPHIARLGELHRRYEAQEFLHRKPDAAPVLCQPVADARISEELVDGTADEMRGGLGARREEQEHHRHHFVRRDLAALALDLDQLRDQAVAAPRARNLKLPFEVGSHLAEREE